MRHPADVSARRAAEDVRNLQGVASPTDGALHRRVLLSHLVLLWLQLGYEIFAYVIGGTWGLEHVVRIVRLVKNGVRTATVTLVEGTDGEYVRIEVECVSLAGTAYLTFPMLSWRFWESHPFSVAYSGDGSPAAAASTSDAEKGVQTTEGAPPTTEAERMASVSSRHSSTKHSIFFARTRGGGTAMLGARAAAAGPTGARLKVLVDGSYVSTASKQLQGCDALLCVGGGIGVTALLSHLRDFPPTRRSRLHWGTRRQALLDALAPELARLPVGTEVATTVGTRLDIAGILRKESAWAGPDEGSLGIVVCGPASMADDVRAEVARLARETLTRRSYVFVDEAFSW